MMDLAARRALAERVLDSIADVRPDALGALAQALTFAGRPYADVGQAFSYAADGGRDLAALRLARALTTTVRHPAYPELAGRLDAVDAPPWSELLDALERVASSLTTTTGKE